MTFHNIENLSSEKEKPVKLVIYFILLSDAKIWCLECDILQVTSLWDFYELSVNSKLFLCQRNLVTPHLKYLK